MDASLKQRLVGAVVLVALAVIFLPMLVKGPAPDSGVSNVSMRIPAEPMAEGKPAGSSDSVSQDLPLVAPAAAPAGGVSGMPTHVAEPAPSAAPDANQAPTPLTAVAAGDFAVSFGSYATAADADKVIAALRAAGLPGYRDAVTIAGKTAQRVRIGPFADRAMAESARLRSVQVRGDITAKVVTLDADAAPPTPAPAAKPADIAAATKPSVATEPKPVAKPAAKPEVKPDVKPEAKPDVKPEPKPAAKHEEPKKPDAKPAVTETPKAEPPASKPANASGTGFVVQMGAFASAADATALRDTLRKAGFNAFTDTVPGANGTLTRVRVGPVINRAEAEALKSKLEHAGKAGGMIRPHP